MKHLQDNNEFALSIYGQLQMRPGNLFFSPLSLRIALGMAHAGARGETAAQMREVLSISSSDGTPSDSLANIIRQLDAAGDREYEIAMANSLWGQDGALLNPEFLDLIARRYDGAMNLVDFRGRLEAARVTMNQWVEEKTKQKIRELIPSGGLDADTRLVLLNAVYFKGTWVLPFDEESTRDQPFHLEGGGRVLAPLMHQQDEVAYLQARGYQAVDLGYRGGDLSMLVLLPDRKDGLRNLEKTLSASLLEDCVAQMRTREVNVFLPRFKIIWGSVDLREQLIALGMPLAFTRSEANFSGINGREPPHEEALSIGSVFHKAFVEVNEHGTEAAAATAATFTRLLSAVPSFEPPIPVFRADHPFLFAIRDRRTGVFLFLGRTADPTLEN